MAGVPSKQRFVTAMGDRTNDDADESDRSGASRHLVAAEFLGAMSFGANRKKRMARQRRISINTNFPPFATAAAASSSNSHVQETNSHVQSLPSSIRPLQPSRVTFLSLSV
ncbi:hypothetical protein BVC80_9101g182 [Macleaya cordata]|uniref:Uncharacterized protein n=1 Tax=Macleaya cordata TaxID=56857 RepID=A0A200QGX3_MACCD|nr:hypothetical protein BVC80_9101g182 [Macleaya cordata]